MKELGILMKKSVKKNSQLFFITFCVAVLIATVSFGIGTARNRMLIEKYSLTAESHEDGADNMNFSGNGNDSTEGAKSTGSTAGNTSTTSKKQETTSSKTTQSNTQTTAPTQPEPTTDDAKETVGGNKIVYLTFDDGPSAVTKRVLDVLDNYGIKATFFVIYSKGCESILKDISDRGHKIGIHSYTHRYDLMYASEDAFFDELNRMNDVVENVTGKRSDIMRFIGGSSNTVSKKYCAGLMSKLVKEVERQGYSYFDWNADSRDATGNNLPASTIVSKTKAQFKTPPARICLLMHDSAGKSTTADALPQIIEYYRDLGYSFDVLNHDYSAFHHQVVN